MRATTALYASMRNFDTFDPEFARTRLDFAAGIVPTAAGVRIEPTEIAGLKAEWLLPDDHDSNKLLLYWHGGAYVIGSCASHRPIVSHVARAAGVRGLLPEYRLAPEHPFPAAINDAVAAYRQLLVDGYSANDIVVAGDSAGGGLTIAMLLAAA